MLDKKLLLIINGLVSIAIMAAVLYFIGVDKIFSELQNINYFYILLSIVFLLIMDCAMAYRIKFILERNSVKIRFRDSFISHMVGMLLSDFTPARSGYFATAATLSYNYKVPSDKAMLAILGPQALDFIVKVVTGTACMMYISWYVLKINDGWFIFLGAALMSLMIVVMLLLLFSKRFLKLFSFSKSFPLTEKIYHMFEKMQENSRMLLGIVPQLLVLVFISWTGKAISWYFVAKSLGITLNLGFPEFLFYYMLQPTVTILEFIPSPTLAGIGLSEGGGAMLLSVLGVAPAKAASFIFLTRIKTTFVNLIAVPETIRTAGALKKDIF
ncbi:MAG: lysylphosphatidylglycerol synthase transmembrane domain-containing protein [Candidatus Micrarchaeia archaeon]